MRPMKPRPPGSAKDALVRLFAEVAQAEGRDAEAGARIAADFLDVSVSLLHKASDPTQPEDLGFRRVGMITERFRAGAAADFLARLAGGVFVPLPEGEGSSRLSALAASAVEEFGQAIAEILRAVSSHSDGGRRLTPAEARRIAAEIIDVVRIMNGLLGIAMGAAEGPKS
jgi:hypothetical protein